MVETNGHRHSSTPDAYHPLTRRRKACYSVVAVVLLIAVAESVLMLAGVEPGLANEDPFVGFQSKVPLFEPGTDEKGNQVFQTAPNRRRPFNDQQFTRHKQAGGFRIFCLGGSTTYGRPYRDSTSFVGWLRAFLQAAAPDTNWEVINCGGVSYASYRLAALMEELIAYEPDLFIIYSGHNEFLERRTYAGMIEAHPMMSELQLILHRSRTVELLRRGISKLRPDSREAARRQFRLSGEVSALLDSSAGLDLYHRDENFQAQVIAHYRFNLGRMVSLARSVGAETVFVRPAVNTKDFSPFKSQHRDGLSDEALATWHELFRDAIHAARTDSYESALDLFDRAAVLDDRYAGLHYERGRVLFELGRFDEAKVAFERALAEDVCPLRMLPTMQQVLTDVAREHRVPVVDFAGELQRKCREESGHSLLGNAYFLDHVHPTIETNRLLGRMLLNHLIEDDVVRPATAWNEKAALSVTRAVMESVNERDHALAKSMLGRVLRWAGKDEEAEKLIASAVEALPDDAPTLSSYAATLKRRGEADEAIAYYRRALQIEPGLVEASVNLGALLVKKGQFDEAITIYTAILEQRPDDGRTMGRLAVALSESGRIEEGESAFLQALRLDADDPTIHINYGQALIHQGRLDEAVARFQAALRSHPGSVRAWVLSGVALSRMGRIAEAVSHYEEALRLDPKSAQAHYNLGVAFLSSGDEDRAVPHFRSAIEADSMLVDAYFNLGQALASLGKFDEAKQHLERALLLAPNDPMAYLQLGMVLMADGQYTESVANLRKGILIAPENVNLRERLAWVLATAPNDGVRDGREAVQLGERLVARLEKSSARAFDSLAAGYAEVGRFDEACRTVELAIKVAEDGGRSGYVVQLRERLSQYRRREPFRLRERD
ncbi:MAG: tetratricopeptide repeat protein [Planctomycetes bacterium]|nr:tetratricopeptide repeat protein [Planctomycetota bacterium]